MDFDIDMSNPKSSSKEFFEKVKQEAKEEGNKDRAKVAEEGLDAVRNDKSVKALKKVKELKSMGV